MKWQKESEPEDIPYLTLSDVWRDGGSEGLLTHTEVHLGRRVYRAGPLRISRKTEQERKPIWEQVKTKKANSDWAKGQGKAKCNSRKRDRSQRHQGVMTG